MGQKKKLGKNRLDKFYYLAKEQGYRSRAAFKLIQLNRKYDFLSSCRALLDLCAAPGGWLQVAAKAMPLTSLIVGVDLVPIKPVRGVKTLVHDITTQACRTALKKEAKSSKFDVVVHDGAPNVGGAWSNEAYTQSALVLDSLRLATEFLAPGGTFVTKVFRSKDYNALLYAFNQLFNKVESTKPTASRNTSAEIFVVCQGYKAPAKIDPRLLDTKHLFQDMVEVKKVMGPEALLREKIKQRRHREGYEEGLSTMHKVVSALSFLVSDTPVEMLGQFTRLALDGADSWQCEGLASNPKEVAEAVRSHTLTNAEIRALCTDLQVLGRSEFKQLLKWRLQLRKALAADLGVSDKDKEKGKAASKDKGKAAEGAAGEGEGGEGEELDPEAALLKEMEEVKAKMEARQKREKKNRREMKKKAKIRALQMVNSQGILADEEGLFGLDGIKTAKGEGDNALAKVVEMSAPAEDEMEELDKDSDDEMSEGEEEELDSDEEALRYEAELEESLEESYTEYLARKGKREEAVREKRRRLGMDGELDSEEEDDEDGPPSAKAGARKDSEEEEERGGGLLVKLDEGRAGVAKTGATMAAQWFGQELFDDANIDVDEDGYTDEEEEAARPAKKAKGETAAAAGPKGQAAAAGDSGSDSDSDAGAGLRVKGGASSRGGDGFEVVPVKEDESSGSGSESEDEYDMLDSQGKAEVLAIAKKMLRRKNKEEIIDASYSRFANHDVGLPRWFEEDEARHRRPIIPVTKAEVEEEKARLRAIDSRPIKKLAEAKARKRRRLHTKLNQAREKAETIANQEDVPTKTKSREIEKLYAKARSSADRKNKGKKSGGSKKRMDGTLKKELLSQKRQAKKMGGRKGAGGRGKGGAKGKGGKGGRR